MNTVIRYSALTLGAIFAGIVWALALFPLDSAPTSKRFEPTLTPWATQTPDSLRVTLSNPPEKPAVEPKAAENPSEPTLETLTVPPAVSLAQSEMPAALPYATGEVFAAINESARAAIVNIYCERRVGRATRITTGSGTIIDPRGVILTNAHVAELLLLEGEDDAGDPNCTIRTGSPARETYTADVLFMPELWVQEFAPDPSEKDPTGTGEEDFALLLITDHVEFGKRAPKSFPYLGTETRQLAAATRNPLLIASYPAIAGTVDAIRQDLYLVSAVATVEELFTFSGPQLDMFSLSGNIAAEQGSSGGAVVNQNGEMIGLIVTSTRATTSLERNLRALSLENIDRRLKHYTGATLSDYLDGDMDVRLRNFEDVADSLRDALLEKFN